MAVKDIMDALKNESLQDIGLDKNPCTAREGYKARR